jgi:hypothetical protein
VGVVVGVFLLMGGIVTGFILLARGLPVDATSDSRVFTPDRLLNPFPPMSSFRIVQATSLAANVVRDEESVLGVVLENEARAYPIESVKFINNEILNDELGGHPLAITWCSRCQSGVAFDREVDHRHLTFAVSGMLWNDNMVMYDVETGSLWSQLIGEAMSGPLKGVRLKSHPAIVTDWKTWRASHPATTVALIERDQETIAPHKQRYPPESGDEFVVAVARGEQAWAWSLALLRSTLVLNDVIDGDPVVLFFNQANDTATVFRRKRDQRILKFELVNDRVVDSETRSEWDWTTGRATSGVLRGQSLEPVTSRLIYRTKWLRFYPNTKLRISDPRPAKGSAS